MKALGKIITVTVIAFVAISLVLHDTAVSRAEEQPLKSIARSNTGFCFDLYSRLKQQKGNLFFSPYSISVALAMTYAGARGNTRKEMAEVLHFPTDDKEINEGFLLLQKHFKQLEDQGAIQIHVANAIWCQKGEKILRTFLDTLLHYYDSRPFLVDFRSNTEAARNRINSWVEKETENRIKNLIPRGALTPFSRLVLTNAIYFKGKWAEEFKEENTKKQKFFTTPGHYVFVPMMYREARFRMIRYPTFRVIELPYVGNSLSMLIFLPEKVDGLKTLEKSLNVDTFTKFASALRQSPKMKVRVYIPKFSMTSGFCLSKTLRNLGMKSAFSGADFSGINGKKNLFLSSVVHKAFVDVNEEGTEAAAATGVMISMTAAISRPIPVFRADHPFIFVIQDNYSGSILFMGRVQNPGN